MKIRNIYDQIRILVEKNMMGNNLNIDTLRFVKMFNFVTIRFQNYILNKRNEDAIRLMAPFLNIDEDLSVSENNENYNIYNLPEDFFD